MKPYPKLDNALLDLKTGRVDHTLACQFVVGAWLGSDAGSCCAFPGAAFRADRMLSAGIAVRQTDGNLKTAPCAALAQIMADGTDTTIRAQILTSTYCPGRNSHRKFSSTPKARDVLASRREVLPMIEHLHLLSFGDNG